ncbi:MAG TPA: heparan-alpha-glucosaminide N-acetyltransferase [Casimicrobiaceae bacterium]|nr:heparan-alpha-glucosaminide N-acetyltransferase [Casimicrobiaceae bacterium]
MKARTVTAKPRPPAKARVPAAKAMLSRVPARRPQSSTGSAASHRIASLDALRGVAIVAMIVYHFCFDLRYFDLTRWDFEHDIRWLSARSAILASFLLIAGISAVLAYRQQKSQAHWLTRIGVIALAALLVTAGSYFVFPQSFIWFGVLHAIAVSLFLARPLLGRPVVSAIAGFAIIASGIAFSHPVFDSRLLGWIGFMTAKPITEDYVPLFPWMGVLLVGVAVGHALVRAQFRPIAPLARLPKAFHLLGRHSLLVYLVHQPLIMGTLWLVAGS